eukprot:c20200_g1_i5.p1 GENE.c20200_g1_i5~~c20200_g1_i5.p1  ORF type:complete len:110 (-),score=12.33 c20200_g1_i5:431-760(-)
MAECWIVLEQLAQSIHISGLNLTTETFLLPTPGHNVVAILLYCNSAQVVWILLERCQGVSVSETTQLGPSPIPPESLHSECGQIREQESEQKDLNEEISAEMAGLARPR